MLETVLWACFRRQRLINYNSVWKTMDSLISFLFCFELKLFLKSTKQTNFGLQTTDNIFSLTYRAWVDLT